MPAEQQRVMNIQPSKQQLTAKATASKNNRSGKRQWMVSAIAVSILLVCCYQLWQMWPSLVLSSIQWQREVNTQLADLLYDAQANPWGAGSYLIGFSFIYGMLHSLGPGHGKVIVTTYLATHPTKVKASLMLTVISAICQAWVAISLVSVLLWSFNASMRVVNQQATSFVSLSSVLVTIMGALICWKAMRLVLTASRSKKIKVRAISPMAMQGVGVQSGTVLSKASPTSFVKAPTSPLVHHHHHENCGCGHQHAASPEQINNASTLREYVGIVAAIGARPCTGAIMVLLFANVVGLYWMGVVSALAMAVGTALTTSIIAIMTLTGKHLVKRYLMAGEGSNNSSWKLAGYYMQLFGGGLLIVIGLLLLSGQDAGMSPVFTG